MDELYPDFYKFVFEVIPDEVTYARLYELGFESFEELSDTIEGYIPANLVTDAWRQLLHGILPSKESIVVKPQNWNQVWESSFHSIIVEGKVSVRASFHQPALTPYEIIIDPKMAFGTGHHATTFMVMKAMLNIDFNFKSVLDFGCGSSILAILAEKLGATEIVAIDYDPWSISNSLENVELNHCKNISIRQGDKLSNEYKTFDIILANITRDILINNSKDIVRILQPGGVSVYSGFILQDADLVREHLTGLGITQVTTLVQEDWCALIWYKEPA